ncbi:hypothetical protein BT96DRAFT_991766 [Gymnopus androsaceus JB14]|uniref:Uncharacterized protein n=1 Tax=Gymnopus androsaceus JB14 TaxID=1447944 RepID=A0A6A4HYU9_9AGAR|nr:hypothetical protein BT96DRAFT_991766 [Gymnopus androsaceus JB14]
MIQDNPELLCGPDTSYTTGSLDRQPWEQPDAVYRVLAMVHELVDLRDIVVYLFEGAFKTWTRFCRDVTDRNIPADLFNKLYVPSTNDCNESALSDLQQMKCNWTGEFIGEEMNTAEDQAFLRAMERADEAKGNPKKRRKLIAMTAQNKVMGARDKKVKRQKKKDARDARVKACVPLTDTTQIRVLLDALVDAPRGRFSNDIKVDELDLQLEWHQDCERRAGKTEKELSIGPSSKLEDADEESEHEEPSVDGEEDLEEESEEEDIGFTRE